MTAPTQSDMLKYNTSSPYRVSPMPATGYCCAPLHTSQMRLQISFCLYEGASEQLHGQQSWVDKLHASLGQEGRPTVCFSFFLRGGLVSCGWFCNSRWFQICVLILAMLRICSFHILALEKIGFFREDSVSSKKSFLAAFFFFFFPFLKFSSC